MNDLPEHISIWGELADTDHELSHVDVHGVRTRVLRAGSGPDLVLLHGTGGHLEAYARDIAGLSADFCVTAYDMVGHGWSGLPDRPYTIDVLTDQLLGLLDALDIGTVHLSGESLGGWVAAWTAAHHPGRVDRLVLNTPGNIANKPEVMTRLRESTLAAVRDPSDATVRRRVEFLFHHTEMVTDELVTLRRAVYSRPGFLGAITNTLVLQDPVVRKNFAWDPAWVGKIGAPTLLLWTEHDPTGGLDEAHPGDLPVPLTLPLPDLLYHLHRALAQLLGVLPLCWHDSASSQESEPPRSPGRSIRPSTTGSTAECTHCTRCTG